MIRYTDRDCWSALIRVAAALNGSGDDLGVELPRPVGGRRAWLLKLEKLAETLNVPIRRWGHDSCGDGPRLLLDHALGVRPAICNAGQTGHNTPRWWKPSAGLGPGAVPRKVFCWILGAVEGALE